jgi:hypothetical protein
MKRSTSFYTYQFNYIYSTGVLYSKYNSLYYFPLISDIFNSALWLKEKTLVLENSQLLKFKGKFSKKN